MFNLFGKKAAQTAAIPLKVFNSESRELEVFTPRKSWEVTLYTCGPTVYDYVHLGNLRAFLFADILKRTLLYNGYNVNHTMNFTDFGHLSDDGDAGEDKIMKGLKREGMDISLKSMRELTNTYIRAFKEDAANLELLEPNQYARASDFVDEQIKLIQTLEDKGYTYETSDGVYFDVAKFPTYGRLGKIDLTKLKDGARVAVNEEKRHPADFAVWKKGDLGWESRWGMGFPGWHIECSAMAMATLGKEIDLHTGGVDNAPTHHNAEIAQSEAATGKTFVRYWLHSEHMQVENAKMAKSAGTGITLRDLYNEDYSALDFRYWLLTSHYRTQINFTKEALMAAKTALHRLKRFVYEECTDEHGAIDTAYQQKFLAAINDDMDTPRAIAALWELLKDTEVTPADKRATMLEMDAVLGVGLDKDIDTGATELGFVAATALPDDIQQLIDEREVARIAQNWPEADRLRDAIKVKGYTLEDTAEGPKVTKNGAS